MNPIYYSIRLKKQVILILSEICAVCAPSRIDEWRPIEQIIRIQCRNSNHVSAPKRNHEPSTRRLCSPFFHTAAIISVCVHAVCFTSCAKYCFSRNCRSPVLTSWCVACHYNMYEYNNLIIITIIILILYYKIFTKNEIKIFNNNYLILIINKYFL
jgi:hypothetical protein